MATAASAAVVAVPATSASAAPVKGLQDQDMTVNNPQLSSSFFADAKAAKVGMARYNVRWDGKSSTPDPGQVALVRNAIQQGAANGIQTVTVAPSLSSIDPGRDEIAQTAVEVLKGRIEGSLLAPPTLHEAGFSVTSRESTAP